MQIMLKSLVRNIAFTRLHRIPRSFSLLFSAPTLSASNRSFSTHDKTISFIEKAKRHGAQSLLGAFHHTEGFDRCLKGAARLQLVL